MGSIEDNALQWTFDRLRINSSPPAGLAAVGGGLTSGSGGTPVVWAMMPSQTAVYPTIVVSSLSTLDNPAFGPMTLPSPVVVWARIVDKNNAAPKSLSAYRAWMHGRLQTPPYAPEAGRVMCCRRIREHTVTDYESGVPFLQVGAEYEQTTDPT